MSTTLELIERAVGRDKFTVLAVAIDQIAEQIQRVSCSRLLDDEIATVDVAELAEANGVGFETMRGQLREVLGAEAVFRLGKRWVIRKRRLHEYLLRREGKAVVSGAA